jgi:hypothetical protein
MQLLLLAVPTLVQILEYVIPTLATVYVHLVILALIVLVALPHVVVTVRARSMGLVVARKDIRLVGTTPALWTLPLTLRTVADAPCSAK